MVLFAYGLADEELPGLAVMIGETFRPHAALRAFLGFRKWRESALWALARPFAERIGLVIGPANRVAHRHVAVLLEMRKRALRRIDGDVGEVWTSQPFQLGVEVGKVAALQQ